MAESTIKIYSSFIAMPSKNMVIDKFDTYISGISPYKTYTKFQYIKQQLNLSIKIDMSQNYLEMDAFDVADLNYVSIKNENDEKTYYYFVINKFWKSKSTIELQLQMDVLNTFKWNDADQGYKVSPKTLVTREHKDRVAVKSVDILNQKTTFSRKVHLMSEGINAPVYADDTNDGRETIFDKLDVSWCLYYKNRNAIDPDAYNEVNPVDCYLVPSEAIEINAPTSSGAIYRTDIPSGKYWLFFYTYNSPTISFDVDGKVYSPYTSQDYASRVGTFYRYFAVALHNDGTNFKVYTIQINTAVDLQYSKWIEIANNPTSVNVKNPPASIKTYEVSSIPSASTIVSSSLFLPSYAQTTINFTATTSSVCLGEEVIDRTDSQNIKIIKLPYCPTSFEMVNDIVSFGSNWHYESGDKMLKLDDMNTKFINEFFSSSHNPLSNLIFTTSTPSITDNRNDLFESKIYHSDYFRPKFVYDSFSLIFKYEQVDMPVFLSMYDSVSGKFPIRFVVSRNIVSKFLFVFPQYAVRYGDQDYPNIVAVSRNNEEVLYTSQYINYLRTGYNYDLKSKERNEVVGSAGLGLSMASTLLGVVGGIAAQNPVVAIGSAIAGGISIASQSVSYAKSVADAENNIARKLEETAKQATSVRNADDVDLLDAYSNNRAKLIWYYVSQTMEDALMDMFYYTGYIAHEQKVPSVNTRYWFNFLQCDLVISATGNMPDDIENKIKEKFKEGVTFFHEHNTYDFSQVKENYEVSIL